MTRIAQLSDPHITIPGRRLKSGRVDPRAQLAAALQWLLAEHVAEPIHTCLISGDLVQDGLEEEYEVLRDLLATLEGQIPVALALGNHDQRDAFHRVLSGIAGLQPAGSEFCAQRVRVDAEVQMLLLDSLMSGADGGVLGTQQLEWLRQELGPLQQTHPQGSAAVVIHHPPFLTGIVDFDDMGLADREALETLLADFPVVGCVMSGHLHRSLIGQVAGRPAVVAPSTAFGYARRKPESPADKPSRPIEPPGLVLHTWANSRWTAEFQILPLLEPAAVP